MTGAMARRRRKSNRAASRRPIPANRRFSLTLSPGNYTAVLSGSGDTAGNGLVEAYEMDSNATRLVNISTRGRVGTVNEPMIGGLITQGGAKKVIIRALGPSLGTGINAITGALSDPVLELRDGSGNLLAVNDDWGVSSQVSEILASTIPPVNPKESAIVATLGAGNYTAIVSGAWTARQAWPWWKCLISIRDLYVRQRVDFPGTTCNLDGVSEAGQLASIDI